jgi:DNA repair photolyase
LLAAPMIPGLTDHELPRIMTEAAAAGAVWSRTLPLRLPGAVAGIFRDWLEREEPNRVAKVLGRVRSIRGGRLNDTTVGRRMRGVGRWAEQLAGVHAVMVRRLGFGTDPPPLESRFFRRRCGVQLRLF